MCYEVCLPCEQCEYFKNGCSGQTGTYDHDLCPAAEGPELVCSESYYG